VVFMFHEWWGLNDYVKAEAERISKTHDVMVVALDLYDGKVATTRDDAAKYMQEMATSGRGSTITAGAFELYKPDTLFAIDTFYVPQRDIITIGWCLGGSWSMKAALLPENEHVVGCVIYYGMPETNADALKNLHAPILGIFANKDKWITPEVVSNFEAAMTKAKKPLTLRTYDADHGFANPSNPNHNKAATEDARNHADEFIRTRFGLK
ncbi:MAG TPA: dienelactone hydrolase family protein, partial [Candidatus Kapabacteria bacterium]